MPDYLSNDYKWWGKVFKVANKVSRQRRNENTFRRKVAAVKLQRAFRHHLDKRSQAATKIQAMFRRKQALSEYKFLRHGRDVGNMYRKVLNERKFPRRRRLGTVTTESKFWDRQYPKYNEEKRSYAWHIANRPRVKANKFARLKI